jgi:ATP-binding protein involved in chromosome partitioning
MSLTPQHVMSALGAVINPHSGKDFASTRAIRDLAINDVTISFALELGYPARRQHEALRALFADALRRECPEFRQVNIDFSSRIVPHAVRNGVKLLPGVKNVIAVASGKGGVG